MRRRGLAGLALGGWLAAGCAVAPVAPVAPTRGEEEVGAPPPAARPSLDEASRRAAERLKALEQRRGAAPGDAPAADLRGRYEELLDRPGTAPERVPEILLRLAELEYREEEAALRGAYEAGTEGELPAGSRYPRSIQRYRRVTDQHPDSPQALTAFYNLGYLYAEEGERARSAWAYSEVLRRDPRTPYADEIHMRLGEAAFGGGDVEGAIPHYRAVVEAGKAEYAGKALYKLGWCLFNLGDYGGAVDVFARVLARGEGSSEGLRRETLEVLAKSFLEWGGVGGVAAYLRERPDAREHGAALYRLVGELYLESSRYREAVEALSAGVDAYPAAAECLAMERGILQALAVVRDPEAAATRREASADRYGPGSAWDRALGTGPLGAARDALVEEALRLAALYHHGRAQRGQGGLDRALRLYERYLGWFGDGTEEGYEMSYAYAQALREAVRLADAADRFARVAAHPSRRAHREDASWRRIEVLSALYRQQPEALDALVAAHHDYARLNPESAEVPRVKFAAGELLFEAGRLPEARAAFGRVTRDHGGHPLAARALERVARCHFREGAFDRAEASARQALAAGLDPKDAGETRRLVSFSVFKQAEAKEETGDLEGANGEFLRLADEFPQEEAAQIALYRVGENLRRLGRDEAAARVYDRLARAYRGTAHARQAFRVSAEIYASLGDWREAAR
ncbi:MAG: tetratricopeptide repeat protein, partial [Deferrisomatales bacterium]